ncbi:MAG TPA: MFS transporter [Rhodospirillales bacterium]
MADQHPRTMLRLSLYYGAAFALIGIHLPFWPVWLAAHGLGPTEIGVVMAVGVGVKLIANPLVAHAADRRGQRRSIMVALALAATAAFALFGWTSGLAAILAVTVLFFAAWSPIMPLAESLTMMAGSAGELDYGRVRLWGSLAFIATAVGAGYLLSGRSPDLIYWVILIALAVTVAATLGLPAMPAPPAAGVRFAPFEVLRDRRFLLFLLAATLIQGSHGVYYAFGTLDWKASGYSENVIGWLWAEGVLAEIVLFAYGARLVRRFGPATLIALGGFAGALRWWLTGTSDALAVLVAMQALHALTFGASHLGAIYFIARQFPAAVSASAQSLYAAIVAGLGMALSALLAGRLYGEFGNAAYLGMAAMAGVGGLAAALLVNRR